MYNQRESLACIVITPALQAGGRGIVTLSAHHHPTENTSPCFHLMKPEGFKPPDIEGLLRKQGWEGEDGR